jgi:hypothetical protein
MSRHAASSTLVMAALVLTGCAGGARWPLGTEAALGNPGDPSIAAQVPGDQRAKVGGRWRVKVPSGTRVAGVDDPMYNAEIKDPTAQPPESPVRIRVTDGAFAGVELEVSRVSLKPLPDPAQLLPGLALWLFVACAAYAFARIARGWLDAISSRREVLRHRAEAQPGPLRTPAQVALGHHPSAGRPPELAYEDWLQWVSARRAKVRADREAVRSSS